MISSGTGRPAIVDANRAELAIEVGHRRVQDALSFPEGFRVSKHSVQWLTQSTKLIHSLDTTRTNVHLNFRAASEVLLRVQLPDTGEGRSKWCCLKTTFYPAKEIIWGSFCSYWPARQNAHNRILLWDGK